jgi:hypothetical protein
VSGVPGRDSMRTGDAGHKMRRYFALEARLKHVFSIYCPLYSKHCLGDVTGDALTTTKNDRTPVVFQMN